MNDPELGVAPQGIYTTRLQMLGEDSYQGPFDNICFLLLYPDPQSLGGWWGHWRRVTPLGRQAASSIRDAIGRFQILSDEETGTHIIEDTLL